MAINKNFVIKNGVEVNTNLLVGDSTLNKVGIGTTLPEYTLHIGIGAGARGGIGVTDIHVSGIATIGVANSTSGALSVTGISTFEGLVDANGGISARTAAVQDLTDNRVVIAGSGGELEDSGNLTFDGSTLTVSGDLDPTNVSIASTLQVAGVATFLSGVLVSGISTFEGNVDAEGDVTVGTGITLQPHGGASFAGIVTVGGNLNVTGDYTVDEISARNLTLTGIATIPTIAGNTNITGVTTVGENFGGFKRLVGAASSTVVSIAVTVATKTSDHRYFGQGSDNGYWLDGVESPFVTLVPGKLYYFDQSHSTNSGHPLRFYLEQDKANSYTKEITTGGSPGSSGAYTQIGIGTASNENNHPAVLHYQCSSHVLMGNAVATQSNAVNLPDSVVTTVRGNLMPGADSTYDIGASGTRFTNIYGDTLYGDGSNLTNLPSQVSIGNNADNRVITGGSGVSLNGEANLTFDGSTLGITGSIDLSADIDVDGTANLDILDVDGASNFGADVVFAGAAANITFDQSTDDLIFDDNAKAIFGSSSDGLEIFHDSSHSRIKDTGTGKLLISGSQIALQSTSGENMIIANPDGAVELYHDSVQTLFTTGIGITVGISTIQTNGNAAFPGITTLGSPGGGSQVIVNNLLNVNSGANITGIATLAQA